jgi:hypothetical protein
MKIKKGTAVEFQRHDSACAVFPDLGGRVFAEVCGLSMHRVDLECVARPNRPFNNFGGGNFWPAPEGGKFAFNYLGNRWCVQECINDQPFEVASRTGDGALLQKRIRLINRAGTSLDTLMKRDLKVLAVLPTFLGGYRIRGSLCYQTMDSFEVLDPLPIDQALIAAWTLEQFEPSASTISFCSVPNPESAINFDFYDHPGDRISYYRHGFTYKTDGLRKGQIGVKKAAGATFIGFYDLAQGLLCTRENKSQDGSLYFNMADNDQPAGPFSASDNYSIFNSDPEMNAFELELISGACVADGKLTGSELVSVTTFALFERSEDIQDFVEKYVGKGKTC